MICNSGENAEIHEQQMQNEDIRQMGSVTVQNKNGLIHCITVVGQIEGHQILPPQNKTTKYEHIMPQLAAIEESEEIDGLLVLLNTVGGDVEAGLAIAELIASMSKPTVSLVLGGGHSIGVPLAVAARRSFIVPTASMTIHPVRLSGVVIGVPQTYAYLEKIQERIVNFVVKNSKVGREQFEALMLKTDQMAADVGSVVYGAEAVRLGIIDCLGGLADALECLHEMIRNEKRRRGIYGSQGIANSLQIRETTTEITATGNFSVCRDDGEIIAECRDEPEQSNDTEE